MDQELFAKLFVQKLVLKQLIHRLREVEGFQMMGLVQDLSQIEAEFGNRDLPENLIEVMEEEMQDFIECVQDARGQKATRR